MFDMHNDLLTFLYYMNNNLDNDKYNNFLKNIYNDKNIIGGIINIYNMSEHEMLNELNMVKSEYSDVTEYFIKSINYLNDYLVSICYKPKFIYSIEGLDYLSDINELDVLYKLGLRSVLPVWNYDNDYGGGIKGKKGLTSKGERLIKYLIDKNIMIDLSHCNKKTFYDIINIVKKYQSKNIKVHLIASHSNVYALSRTKRNLTDHQLKSLSDVGGYIGIVSYKKFISQNNIDYKNEYIKHIKYLLNNIGFNEKHIVLSSDDMSFFQNDMFNNLNIFDIHNYKNEVYNTLKNNFDKNIISDIMYNNGCRLINELV